MADESALPRRRLPWWWIIGGGLIGLVGLAAIALAVWVRTDGDLQRADARIRAAGLAATWEELGLQVSPPPVLDAYDRLRVLFEANKSYQETVDGWYGLKPGDELPAELIAHHAAQPPTLVDEIGREIAALRGQMLLRADRSSFSDLLPDLQWERQASRWFAERQAVADAAAFHRLADLHAVLLSAVRPRTLLEALVLHSRAAIWMGAVHRRIADPGIDREGIAGACEALARQLERSDPGAMQGELLLVRDACNQLVSGERSVVRQLDLPHWLAASGAGRLLGRAGRGEAIGYLADCASLVRDPDPARRLEAARLKEQEMLAWSPAWHPRYLITRMLAPAIVLVVHSGVSTAAALRVTAAELRGAPWPADPTDPSGGHVRRIERGGRLIGFYLCGKDGVDDKGHVRNDRCFAMHERLGQVMAADQPPPPVP